MASYRGHLAAGGALAIAGTALVSAAITTDTKTFIIFFLLVIAGAFLPDVDSDSSLPFYMVYGAITLGATTLITNKILPFLNTTLLKIVIPLGVLLFMWYVVGGIVKNQTRHRGMIHSIPAAAVVSMLTVLLATNFGADPLRATLFGAAVGAGFLSHLLLDEIFSIVDFHGLPFIPNKAFGSALKLASSPAITMLTYLLIAGLAYKTYPIAIVALSLFP